jgi:hypothetical protein
VVAWLDPLLDDTVVLVAALPVDPVELEVELLPVELVEPAVQAVSATVPAKDAATSAAVVLRARRVPCSRVFISAPVGGGVPCRRSDSRPPRCRPCALARCLL